VCRNLQGGRLRVARIDGRFGGQIFSWGIAYR
jgi:hypothetical protein